MLRPLVLLYTHRAISDSGTLAWLQAGTGVAGTVVTLVAGIWRTVRKINRRLESLEHLAADAYEEAARIGRIVDSRRALRTPVHLPPPDDDDDESPPPWWPRRPGR